MELMENHMIEAQLGEQAIKGVSEKIERLALTAKRIVPSRSKRFTPSGRRNNTHQ
jgi:hypothetical protein